MKGTRVITDLAECSRIWKQLIPQEQLSDLWEIRLCFQRHYGHQPYFIVGENRDGINGFLPLSRNEETDNYLYFPGETWESKTWLEQNRLIAQNQETMTNLLNLVPGNFYLRYLQPNQWTESSGMIVDEIGYYFLPPAYDYDINKYFGEFSGKSAKRLRREIEAFEIRGVEFEHNNRPDFETMVTMSLQRYGSFSYFHDTRFLNSFRSLFSLLVEKNCLRLTSVKIGGQVAAVDMGSIFNNTYTLLAGGTNAEFPGVAKLINLHHMRWACDNKIERVDFLCGDFNWKTQFHLAPRPLFKLTGQGKTSTHREMPLMRQWDLPQSGVSAGSRNIV
jgi:hypothetical protein